MKPKRITIIWLPSINSRSYLFSVSRLLIYVFFATLLASWVMLGVRGYSGIRLHRDYLQVKEENTRLTQIQIELDSLQKSMDSIQEYEELIRNLLGLETQRREGVGMGQGGIPADELFRTTLEESPVSSRIFPIPRARTPSILERAESLQERFQELVEILREQRQFLEHAPSIVPLETKDYWMSSAFGWRRSPFTGEKEFHHGVDISARRNTPIIAPGNGRVIKTGYHTYRGKYLQISHGWGRITTFAHLSKFNVTESQVVKRGQVIAYMGSTGRATGSHLHYEIEIDGEVVNPMHHILNYKKGSGQAN